MKRMLSFALAAVLLFCCAFSAQCADVSEPYEEPVGTVSDDAPAEDAACDCPCHLFYSMRDTLPQQVFDRTIDCKTLLRVLSYYLQLFTWRVLGVRQYCACGSRHY